MFLRLTATSSDGADSADRVTRAELTTGKSPDEVRDVGAVLEAFAAERLLTLAAGTVELSHEALLTAWPLLRDTWLADTHAERIVRSRLHTTAAEWLASPATRPTSTAAACCRQRPIPPPGPTLIPPATRRLARPNVPSSTPAPMFTAVPSAGGRP